MNLFTRKEISLAHGISADTIRYRATSLGFDKNDYSTKLYSSEQVDKIVNFYRKGTSKIPEIIHHTVVYHIYESKLNNRNYE